MSTRAYTGATVLDGSIERMVDIYNGGHRVVISFSGGKDSTVLLEVCIIAAKLTGRLPVEAVIRDEEIMVPGTYEFVDRTAQRPEVQIHHLVTRHAISNVFNRAEPFWFAHDPRIPPERWVREPPDYAVVLDETDISRMTIPERFPPAPGKDLYAATGLRVSESIVRMYSIYSAGGHVTRRNRWGTYTARPVYDWSDGDAGRPSMTTAGTTMRPMMSCSS